MNGRIRGSWNFFIRLEKHSLAFLASSWITQDSVSPAKARPPRRLVEKKQSTVIPRSGFPACLNSSLMAGRPLTRERQSYSLSCLRKQASKTNFSSGFPDASRRDLAQPPARLRRGMMLQGLLASCQIVSGTDFESHCFSFPESIKQRTAERIQRFSRVICATSGNRRLSTILIPR